jgi:hypothetical protein
MREVLIVSNWLASLVSFSMGETDTLPLWAPMLAVLWFGSASMLLNHARRHGWLRLTDKYLKDL